MPHDAHFDVMDARWAEAYRQARAYCMYFLGTNGPIADTDLLAQAHRALIEEEDPGQYLTRLSQGHSVNALLEPTKALSVA